MSDRFTGRMINMQQGRQVYGNGWRFAEPHLQAGREMQFVIQEATRSISQNDKFHALCRDISRSKIQWAGKSRSPEDWKAIIVSGHAVATGQGGEVVPGIEGEFVSIRESTSKMSKARGSSLIEYTLAFCAEHGVTIFEERL